MFSVTLHIMKCLKSWKKVPIIGKKENYSSVMYHFKSCCEIKLPFNVKPKVGFSSLDDNSNKWKGKQLPRLLSDDIFTSVCESNVLWTLSAREDRSVPRNIDGVQCIVSFSCCDITEAQAHRLVEEGRKAPMEVIWLLGAGSPGPCQF